MDYPSSKKKRTLNEGCFLYFLYHNSVVVYIGSTIGYIEKRIAQHLSEKKIFFDSYSFSKIVGKDRFKIETECIVKYNPFYNKTLPCTQRYIHIKKLSTFFNGMGKHKTIIFFSKVGIRPVFKESYYDLIQIRELFEKIGDMYE